MTLMRHDPWSDLIGNENQTVDLRHSRIHSIWGDSLRSRNRHRTLWFDPSFYEMEQRVSNFMKMIDQRFNGMLELINVDTDPIYPIPVIHEGLKEEKKKRESEKYTIEINVQDFKPEEVTVHVSNGKVQVHAKQETKNEDVEMYAHTYREFRRTFVLPKGIKTENVVSTLTADGILRIEGTRQTSMSITPMIAAIPIAVIHETQRP